MCIIVLITFIYILRLAKGQNYILIRMTQENNYGQLCRYIPGPPRQHLNAKIPMSTEGMPGLIPILPSSPKGLSGNIPILPSLFPAPPRQHLNAKMTLSTEGMPGLLPILPSSLPAPLVSSLHISNAKNGGCEPLNENVIDNTITTPANTDYNIINKNIKGNVYNTYEEQRIARLKNLLNSDTVQIVSNIPESYFVEHTSSPMNISCKPQSSEEMKSSQISLTGSLYGLKSCMFQSDLVVL